MYNAERVASLISCAGVPLHGLPCFQSKRWQSESLHGMWHAAQVFNAIGESDWSEPGSFTTQSSVPNAPEGLCAVDSTNTSIAVHWQVLQRDA